MLSDYFWVTALATAAGTLGVYVLVWVLKLPQRAWATVVRRPSLRLEPVIAARERLDVGWIPLDQPTPLPVHALEPTHSSAPWMVWVAVHNDAERPQADALDASLRLEFRDGPTGTVHLRIPGRWRNSLQGFQTLGDTAGIEDRITIRAGRSQELDVALRYDGAQNAYALNTESHRHPGWQHPGWELAPGRYVVRVTVSARNSRTRSRDFDLHVPLDGGLEIRGR